MMVRICILSALLAVSALPAAEAYIDDLQPQVTCPPCRQALENFDRNVWVEFGGDRVYVCCSGCATKMQKDWGGYRAIMERDLREKPERLEKRISALRPLIHNPDNVGVCEACRGGRCMLPEHLPNKYQK